MLEDLGLHLPSRTRFRSRIRWISRTDDYLSDGYVAAPDSPGLGVDLNYPAIEENLRTPGTMFLPTEEWDAPKLGFWRPDDRWSE